MSILRLFEDSDPVVEYDDREHCNLFDFREPKDAALSQRRPTLMLSRVLTSVQGMPLHQQRKVEMHPCYTLQENDWAGTCRDQASTWLQDIPLYDSKSSDGFTYDCGALH